MQRCVCVCVLETERERLRMHTYTHICTCTSYFPSLFFITALVTSYGLCPQEFNSTELLPGLPRPHLLKPPHWELRHQHMNLDGHKHLVYRMWTHTGNELQDQSCLIQLPGFVTFHYPFHLCLSDLDVQT